MKLTAENSIRRSTRLERNIAGWYAYKAQLDDLSFEEVLNRALLEYQQQHAADYPNGPTVPAEVAAD